MAKFYFLSTYVHMRPQKLACCCPNCRDPLLLHSTASLLAFFQSRPMYLASIDAGKIDISTI